MKEKIQTFINGLISYDYMLFGGVFLLFLILIILSIVLRKKLGLSIFFMLFSFITLFVGPVIGYPVMHKLLFKNKITLISQKKLSFTPAVIVHGSIENSSNFDFKSCKITASVLKSSKNNFRRYLYSFKPLKKKTIIKLDIPKGKTKIFKIIIEPFKYKRDINISLKASCK